MFGKKNFTNTQVTGRITNPEDDILINVDNNDLTLYSKYKKGSPNLTELSVLKSADTIDDIKLYQSASGLVDYNGYQLSANNKHLEDGLVAWYDKVIDADSGLITDKSGNDINGTLTSITNTDDGLLYFDGTNDYITGSSKAIKSEGSNVSVAVWVKPDTYVDSGSVQFLVGQVNTGATNASDSNKDYKLEISANNNVYFVIHSNTTNNILVGNQALVLNQWNHVVCTYDNTTSKAYLNGVFIGSNSTVSPTLTSVYDLTIARGSTNEDKFSGYMKDIRVYNRVIETNEIIDLYNNGVVDIKDVVSYGDIELPTPNIYLKMQEGVSSSVINYGNDNANITGSIVNYVDNWKYIDNKPCIEFDGTDDQITIGHSTVLNGALTISLWVYFLSDGTPTQGLITKHYRNEFEIWIDTNINAFNFYFGNGTIQNRWKIDYTRKLNTWYHIVVTRNNNTFNYQTIIFYVNGEKYIAELYTNNITSGTIYSNTNNNILMGSRVGGSSDFKGYMNNVRIYNSELTEQQILKIYHEELTNSSSFIRPDETTKELKTITTLKQPQTTSLLDNSLLLNLTGQDSSTDSYVLDYTPNRYNATLTEGTLTYSASNAATISASNTIVFDGSTELTIDGTKLNGYELKDLSYSELTFSTWLYLYDISSPRAIMSSDILSSNIYNIYVDTNGRVNVLYNGGVSDTIIFNQVLSATTWYNVLITFDNGDIKCFIGTTSTEPTEVAKYDDTHTLGSGISNRNIVAKYLFNDTSSTTLLSDYGMSNLNGTMSSFSSGDLSQRGYTFDGTDNLIQLPNNDAFYTTNITFSVLFTTPTSSKQDIITFNQGIELSYSGYILRLQNYEISFITETYKETSVPSNSLGYRITNKVASGYSTNTLTFLTLVLNGSGSTFSTKIYKNGQELTPTTYTDNSASNSFEWPTVDDGRVNGAIGGANSIDNMFTGTIYDVRFFNTVLTASQVSNLYNTVMYNYNNSFSDIHSLKIAKSELIHLNTNIYFKGKLDDIKVYSKALTPAEITTNWNSGAVNYFSTDNNSTDLIINLDGKNCDNVNELGSALYLKIDEGSGTTLTDTGKYNNGTINGASWSTDAPSYFSVNKSLEFDGTDDYISINSYGGVNLSGALTISLWLYAYDENAENVLFSKSYKNEFDMRIRTGSINNFRLYFGNGSQYETWTSASFSEKLNYNAWNHIVITRDTGSAVRKDINGYVNGEHLNFTYTSGGDLAISSSSNPIYVCARSSDTQFIFCQAKIADFRIYDRELNDKAVTYLYNSYLNENTPSNSILDKDNDISVDYTGTGDLTLSNINGYKRLYLKLNEGSGNTVYDYHFRYGNGTISGCNWVEKNTPHNDNSLYFDGTDDYVYVYHNISDSLNGALTVSFWVKLDNLNSGQTFFSKGYKNEFDLSMFSTTIQFFDGNTTSNNSYGINKTDIGLQANVWTHIVITRNQGTASGKIVKIYVNGTGYTMTPGTNSYTVSTNSSYMINIGKRSGGTNYVNGYISQFMIFARELTHSEILDLYNYSEGWSSMAKYGNFAYDLNDSRKLTITTGSTNTECSGELWVKPSRVMQQTILKSNYNNETTRSNGDIKLELVPADSNYDNLIANWHLFRYLKITNDVVKDYTDHGTNLSTYNIVNSDRLSGLNLNKTVYTFDGTNDYCTTSFYYKIPDYFYNAFKTAYNAKHFSISVWVYPHTDNTKTILCMTSGSTYRVLFFYIDTSERINFKIRNNSGTEQHYYTTSSISINTWTHITLVYNESSSQDIKIYVNGDEWGLSNYASISNLYTYPNILVLYLGSGPAQYYFKGSITDLRIYNKALTQSEIQEVMKQQYKPQLSIKLGGSVTTISNNNALISKDNWSHLAYNYNSSNNELRLYMNGDEIAQNTSLTNTTAVDSNIILGNQSFEGQINNYSAYSRNLTANEIKYIYLGLDRLKLQLTGKLKNNTTFTSDLILFNKAKNPSNTFIHPYGDLTLIEKDNAFNNVLNFNGSTSYIELDPESDLWRSRSFTITMWIKPNSSGSGTSRHIFSRYSSSYQSYYLAYDYTDQELDIIINDSSTSTTSIEVLKGVYTHIAVSFGLNNINVYINGNYVKSIEIPQLLNIVVNSTLKTVIGDSSDLSNKYNGYIADFRYYDTDLSSDAIRTIYAGYDLNNTNSSTSNPELAYVADDLTTVRNKDFVQPAKSALKLHLNNYTTGSIIASSSDNGLVATATSMVSSTSEFDFNGSSSYLLIADNDDINISGTALTLSMWIKADTLAAFTSYHLLQKGSTTDYGLRILSSKKLIFTIGSVYATSNTILTTDVWYHITAIYDGSNMKIYINGEDDNATVSDTPPSNVPNSGTNIYIGTSSPVLLNIYYDGKMRDIRIYNSAISTETIKLIYNAGLTTTGEFSIAANKKIENAERYAYVSKYLIDDNNETTAVLGDIARDNLLIHFNGSNTGTTYLDQSTLAIPSKMTSLRPNYLSSDKILSYTTNNGTLSSVGLISAGTGTINSNTVLFDGATTSNIVLTDVEDKMLETWTFATWYKLTNPSNKNIFLSRKETSKNLDLFIDSTDNEIKVKYNTTTVSSDLAIDTSDYGWHHLAISKGQEGLASNIVSFYYDGELVNQKRVDTALTTSATSLLIGSNNTTGFYGYMDEIRLYSSRLNDVEIGKLARGELLGGPVHYWMMEDETSGRTVRDMGSAGNNLCLQGSGATWNTTSANVKYGTRSLKFEGTTSNFASSAAVGVLGDQGRCISMWFKRSTSGDEASEQQLISYGNSSTSGEQFSVVINTSSNIQVNIGSTSNIRGTTRINDTDWHHLTILQLSPESGYYSDDRAIKILVDTVNCTDTSSYTQTSINTRITGSSDLLTIGKGFKGYINEASVFNYSLSKPEIDVLYANKNHYMLNLN
jgi:hypothetical protein